MKTRRRLAFGSLSIVLFSASCWAVAPPDGYIVRSDSGTLYLDWGRASGIAVHDHFSVQRPGIPLKHPVTGESLGTIAETVAHGEIEMMDEKFSRARLLDQTAPVRIGDRTHVEVQISEPRPSVTIATAAAKTTTDSQAPSEVWRSDAFPFEAVSVTTARLSQEGYSYIVVADRRTLHVYRWTKGALEPLTDYRLPGGSHWLSVDALDLRGEGHDTIFATAFTDGMRQARIVVLELSDGKLKEETHLAGLARRVTGPDGRAILLQQNVLLSKEIRLSQPVVVEPRPAALRLGATLGGPRLNDDQVFGLTFGRWDGASISTPAAKPGAGMAVIQRNDQLRVFVGQTKWTSNESYGGTRNNFTSGDDETSSMFPRLETLPSGDRDVLLVPHNFPELGIRTTYLKFFKRGELVALRWNGVDMAPIWRIPVPGYLADYALAEGEGIPRVWLAIGAPGGKTVLAGYRLP